MSRLGRLLERGRRVLTIELPPFDTVDADVVTKSIEELRPFADAINVVDNSAARAHPSSVAVAALARQAGAEPVLHLTCRDRNRLALQSELLGAALLGVENVLCLTGDDVSAGDEPEAKRVFDLDSPQLLALATILNEGKTLSARRLSEPPQFFLGAAENPYAPPFEARAERAVTKARAGARFFQLQVGFEIRRLARFLERAEAIGLLPGAHMLATVCVVRSARGLRFLQDRVPGVFVPDYVLESVERLAEREQAPACLELALDVATSALSLPGVAGLHLVSFQGASAAAELRALVDAARDATGAKSA
jgi:methylenetetrahydrofolate reductase (NADPH)